MCAARSSGGGVSSRNFIRSSYAVGNEVIFAHVRMAVRENLGLVASISEQRKR